MATHGTDLALAIVGAIWLLLSVILIRRTKLVSELPHGTAPDRAPLPRVSIVVAARNEAARIGETVRRLLDQRGIDLELIVVDDRSCDATPSILASLTQRDGRLRVLRIDALPDDWLGKPHACRQGAAEARGEWLLFSDADAWLGPDVVARAIAAAECAAADHVCLIPGESDTTLPGAAGVLGFYFVFLFAGARVNIDRYRGPIGVGAFNLVRSTAYRSIGGHSRLRFEVLDDAKLGMLLLESGHRSRVYWAQPDFEVAWAGSLRGLWRVLEKNLFAALEYRTAAALALGLSSFGLWGVALAGPALSPIGGTLAFAGLFSLAIPAARISRQAGWGWLAAILAPLFLPALPLAVARSTAVTLLRGGVRWRETFYALDRLRLGVVRARRTP